MESNSENSLKQIHIKYYTYCNIQTQNKYYVDHTNIGLRWELNPAQVADNYQLSCEVS